MSEPDAPRGPEPIDWGTARRVARTVAGHDAIAVSYLGDSLSRDFEAASDLAQELVAAHTGLVPPSPARAQVVDRREWVDVNLESMRRLLQPLTQRIGARMPNRVVSGVGRQVAATELGLLLGYVAQRVLGQYDLLVLDEGLEHGDVVYYVAPNVLALEKRYAFRPEDFRRWIAIHELTHRAQFTAVPWMQDHFGGLVGELIGSIDPDPKALLATVRRAVSEVTAGRNPLDGHGLVGLVATPSQRVALDRVQALMTLLEGHGNAVMDELGAQHVHGSARMSRVLHARRRSRGLAAVVGKLLGFEMKMRQYEVGEQFVRSVERLGGSSAIDAAWQSPESLPTLDEIEAPQRWLDRVGSPLPGGAPAAS